MTDCYGCRRPLNCSWYVYLIDSPYFEATSCFDISNGYLLCATTSDWIFCFCDSCWHRYTVALSSIIHKNQINALERKNYLLKQKLTISERNCAVLQEKVAHLDVQNQSVDNLDVTKVCQVKPLEAEIEQIQTAIQIWNTFSSMFTSASEKHLVLKLFLRQSVS